MAVNHNELEKEMITISAKLDSLKTTVKVKIDSLTHWIKDVNTKTQSHYDRITKAEIELAKTGVYIKSFVKENDQTRRTTLKWAITVAAAIFGVMSTIFTLIITSYIDKMVSGG